MSRYMMVVRVERSLIMESSLESNVDVKFGAALNQKANNRSYKLRMSLFHVCNRGWKGRGCRTIEELVVI